MNAWKILLRHTDDTFNDLSAWICSALKVFRGLDESSASSSINSLDRIWELTSESRMESFRFPWASRLSPCWSRKPTILGLEYGVWSPLPKPNVIVSCGLLLRARNPLTYALCSSLEIGLSWDKIAPSLYCASRLRFSVIRLIIATWWSIHFNLYALGYDSELTVNLQLFEEWPVCSGEPLPLFLKTDSLQLFKPSKAYNSSLLILRDRWVGLTGRKYFWLRPNINLKLVKNTGCYGVTRPSCYNHYRQYKVHSKYYTNVSPC